MATKASGGGKAPAKAAAKQAASDAPVDVVAKAYDAMPYQSKPFSQSTPEQLAVMARLFRLNPPEVSTARVLELGCAAGGNIIPLAVNNPKLHAVGVDISNVEIEQGKIQLVKLGIENCELHALDIAKSADQVKGLFDYIICHGVYSWVPEHVREAILKLVQDKLSPNGVAYISYNVYPGWKFREVIRDMMMFHAGGLQEPAQRLGQAKAILEYIKGITGENSTYGKMLRDEAGIVSRVSDDYLMHEHLSHENKPMYFREFVQQAADHKLAYLGEAHLSDMAPQRLGNDVYQTLSKLSAGNILATEQYMDFFTNRTFRQTLLVHQDAALKVDRAINPEVLKDFRFTTQMVQDMSYDASKATDGVIAKFADAGGRAITVRAAFSLVMLQTMQQRKPYPVSVPEMVAACRAQVPALAANTDEQITGALCTELLNLLLQNMVRLHVAPVAEPKQMDKPKAYPLARVQAEAGQSWATSLLHVPVGISAGHRSLLAVMDGKRGHAQLEDELVAQFKDGRLTAQRGDQPITDEAELRSLAKVFLPQALNEMKQLGLLV